MKAFYSILFLIALLFSSSSVISAQQATVKPAIFSENKSISSNEIIISAYDNKIFVENAPVGSKIEIYSVVGIRVKEIVVKQPTAEYTLDIAKGYYIIRIGETVRKIAIR